jgi:hypothetical protein
MAREEKDYGGTPAFDNVKEQIGHCGLWCGSCAVGNGTIRDLARRLEKLTKDYGIREWGPCEIDYTRFHKDLRLIHDQPLCAGCLKGGGKSDCEIRACAVEKGLDECTECGDISNCSNRKVLDTMRAGGLRVGMVVKNEKGSRSVFLKKRKA